MSAPAAASPVVVTGKRKRVSVAPLNISRDDWLSIGVNGPRARNQLLQRNEASVRKKLKQQDEHSDDGQQEEDEEDGVIDLSQDDDDDEQEQKQVTTPATAASATAPTVTPKKRGQPRKSNAPTPLSSTPLSLPPAAAEMKSPVSAGPTKAQSSGSKRITRTCQHCARVFPNTHEYGMQQHETACALRTPTERARASRGFAAGTVAPAVAAAAAVATQSPSPSQAAAEPASPSTSSKLCPHCNQVVGRLPWHMPICAKKTVEEREVNAKQRQYRKKSLQSSKSAQAQQSDEDMESSGDDSEREERKTPSKAKAPSSASKSTAAAKSATPKRGRRSSGSGISKHTGLVKSTSAFPLPSDAMLKKVGYTLGEEDSDSDPKLVYQVEAVRSRRFNVETLQYEYEIKWLGWPEDENTWEPARDTRCPDLIQAYHISDEEFLQTQIDDAVEIAFFDPPCVAFHRDGLCQLTDPALTLPKSVVDQTEAFVTKLFNATLLSISNRDQLDTLRDRGFDRFKMRQQERYDLTLDPESLPFLASPPWLDTVKQILGGNAFLKHAGCMMSLPTSATQSWHSDGDHRDENTHLPCWMLNVFVPLVDMTKALGGTELNPGSHVLFDEYIRTTSVTPLLKAGQCLIFDYRIRHRGLGNRSTTARPVLYFSYAGSKDIVDEKNFNHRRYAVLPPPVPGVEQTRAERLKHRRQQRGEQDISSEEEKEESDVASDEQSESEANEARSVDDSKQAIAPAASALSPRRSPPPAAAAALSSATAGLATLVSIADLAPAGVQPAVSQCATAAPRLSAESAAPRAESATAAVPAAAVAVPVAAIVPAGGDRRRADHVASLQRQHDSDLLQRRPACRPRE